MPDADLDDTAANIVAKKVGFAGQTCVNYNRIYIHESIYDVIDEIKDVRKAPDTERVYMPGEIEFDAEKENLSNGGVPIQEFQIKELNEEAAVFGFTFEEYL